MPVHTFYKIVIILPEAASQPLPSLQLPFGELINVRGLSHGEADVWALSVSEDSGWENQLTTDESEHLMALLALVPSQDMHLDHPGLVLDGSSTEMWIMYATHSLSFIWADIAWQDAPNSQREVWSRVASIADYVTELVSRYRPANGQG
jgi:hypothetical protein